MISTPSPIPKNNPSPTTIPEVSSKPSPSGEPRNYEQWKNLFTEGALGAGFGIPWREGFDFG